MEWFYWMLARAYRITDKVGIVALKSVALVSEIALERTSLILQTLQRGGGGLIGLLRALILALVAGGAFLVARVNSFVRWLATVFGRLSSALFALSRSGVQRAGGMGRQIATTANRSATRTRQSRGRVANAPTQVAPVDVGIREDPLKSQNRVLSALIVVTLVALIGIVIWATSSNNTNPSPIAPGSVNLDVDGIDNANAPQNDEVQIENVLAIPTAVPTATDVPTVLQVGGTVAYTVRELGQTDIWGVEIGSRQPIRLTNSSEDDRDPAWSPDGLRLAYASRQEDSNWDIYIFDLSTSGTTRMTFNLAFEGAPNWSPDGEFLVYESYQRSTHLDIFVMRSDGSEAPQRLPGSSESADFSPVWSPNEGRQIAFVSWRDGSKDIFVFDLNTGETTNITNTPDRNEDHPAWSPDGDHLAFSAFDAGIETVFVKDVRNLSAPAQVLRQGRQPTWSPDGNSIMFAIDSSDSTFLTVAPFVDGGVATEVIQVPLGSDNPAWFDGNLPTSLVNAGGLEPGVTDSLYIEQFPPASGDPPYQLDTIVNIEGPELPVLNERVNDSFNALRIRANDVIGWDFLGELTDAFWQLERRNQTGASDRDWHKSGRAISFNRNQSGFPPPYEIIMEMDGVNTFWRVFVRVADEAQNGQLGEPLRDLPWDFGARDTGDVEAYNQGGRLRTTMPEGYYVDLTTLASDYGWQSVPAGSDWRSNFFVRNYWTLQKRDSLTWYEAMREIYTDAQLGGFVPTPTPAPNVEDESTPEDGS